MQVTLVNYSEKQNIANKANTLNWIVKTTQDVTTYGSFNPNMASFRLDTLYDVNYAKYTFNGHDYYGYVEIDVDADGLYNYKITIDPLTTAWYADCFVQPNIIQYSSVGDAVVFDPRVIQELNTTYAVDTYSKQSSFQPYGLYGVITICNGQAAGIGLTQTPGFDTYIMDVEDLQRLLRAMYNLKQGDTPVASRFLPSVVGCYIIPKYELNVSYLNKVATDLIYLYAPTTDDREQVRTVERYELDVTGIITNSYYYGDAPNASRFNYNRGVYDITISPAFTVSSQWGNASVQVVVPGYGQFNVPVGELMGNDLFGGAGISSLGYEKRFDWVSGTAKVMLRVNGGTYHDYSLSARIPTSVPMMYDTNITNWAAMRAGAAVNVTTAVINTGAAIAGAAATGGATLSNAVTEFLKMTGTVHNVFDTFKNQEIQDKTYSGVTQGCIGGTPEWYELPSASIKHKRVHNLNDIQTLYGKPDGKSRVIKNMTGYVQTSACQLVQQYLPRDIITQAEALSNAGFYIVG